MKSFEGFLSLCVMAKEAELRELFEFFLTAEERSQLAGRVVVIQALLKGELTQREIAENLGVSISQITRGSNALRRISTKLKRKLKEKLC